MNTKTKAELVEPSASMAQSLTPRERQVVALVAEGSANKEIARRLKLSEGTIKAHLHNIYRKLGVSNRTALTSFAIAHQIVLSWSTLLT